MQFTPDYTLKLKDGKEIPLLFNHWAYKTFSKRKGIEYGKMAAGCFPDDQGNPGETYRADNYADILLLGAETYCKFNNIPFTHSDLDSCLWVDDIGWTSKSEQMGRVGEVFIKNLWREISDQIEVKGNEQLEADKKKVENV